MRFASSARNVRHRLKVHEKSNENIHFQWTQVNQTTNSRNRDSTGCHLMHSYVDGIRLRAPKESNANNENKNFFCRLMASSIRTSTRSIHFQFFPWKKKSYKKIQKFYKNNGHLSVTHFTLKIHNSSSLSHSYDASHVYFTFGCLMLKCWSHSDGNDQAKNIYTFGFFFTFTSHRKCQQVIRTENTCGAKYEITRTNECVWLYR